MDQHMGQALHSWGRISLSLGHYWEGSTAQGTSPLSQVPPPAAETREEEEGGEAQKASLLSPTHCWKVRALGLSFMVRATLRSGFRA